MHRGTDEINTEEEGRVGPHAVLRAQSSFVLLRLAARMREAVQEELEELGLRWEPALALLVCRAVDGLSQQALADRTGLDRTTVSQLLADLEEDGYLQRRPSPVDRRRRGVHLTRAGLGLAADAAAALERAERTALRPLRGRERQRLAQLAASTLPRPASGLWSGR